MCADDDVRTSVCVDDDVRTQYVYIMLRLQCVWMMM